MDFLHNVVKYINSLKSKPDNHVEVEFKLLLDSRIKLPHFISPISNTKKAVIDIIRNSLSKNATYAGVSQTINFIKTQENMFVKQLVYIDGVQDKEKKIFYSKKSLIPPIYFTPPYKASNEHMINNAPSLKLSINMEIPERSDINEFDIIRFRLRYSLAIEDWRLDLTFVKETHNNSIASLKIIRDRLFATIIPLDKLESDFNWDYPDRIELELEYISDLQNFSVAKIIAAQRLISDTYHLSESAQKTYKDCICEIAQLIRPSQLDKFSSGNYGLKQLGTNPLELNKKIYADEIVPHIDDFMITEKIDGIRSMIIINISEKICYIINNKSESGMIAAVITSDISDVNQIILDAEAVGDSYYVFDILKFHNTSVHELPFSERYRYLRQVINMAEHIMINDRQFIFAKHFMELSYINYGEQLRSFYEVTSNMPYKIDGLIFVSKNDNYIKTSNYKWKPLMTIDFVAKLCPAGMLGISPYIVKPDKTLYLLFNGIRRNEYRQLGIERFKLFEQIFKGICVNKYGRTSDNYLPIQFAPSSNPLAYLFWSDNPELDNKIVELYYDLSVNDWQLLNIRNDRQQDLARKSYYGNYFKYAEQIWTTYQNPLTLNMLCGSEISKSYFRENSGEYVAARKFNNYVKKQIISLNAKQTDLKWVICLAAGKGQDLFKYTECGFENILCVDIDYDALAEIINRKYIYIDNGAKNASSDAHNTKYSKIFVKRLDLSDNYKMNIEKIFDSGYGLPASGSQFVVCNLALHYIISNKTKAQNFANLLNKIMAAGGIFIFTAFSGKKVFDVLESAECKDGQWNRYDSSGNLTYSIKKKYSGVTFTGSNQKIDVLLPFSKGEYYTENLINMDILNEALSKKKINLIASDSFDIYFDKFANDNPTYHSKLTNNDKEYCSFYHFYIYHKNIRK